LPTPDTTSLRVTARASLAEDIRFDLTRGPIASPGPGHALVEVRAAAVNPSDVKAALGLMPYAVFPRTTGRDFAGVVVDGPAEWIGRDVFGSSGDLGIRRDGSHATHLLVEADALVEKPADLSMEQAAGLGVPFVTAMEAYARSGLPRPGETVLVLGRSGRVGQAAAQIAEWRGARVIGVNRSAASGGAAEVIDASREDVAARVKHLTRGRGADIVFNTVGEPYFAAGVAAAAVQARLIFIASLREPVAFDIFGFYRARHTFIGIDTLALSSVESGARLRDLLPGFASGALSAFPIVEDAIYPLSRAAEAFGRVMSPSAPRIILRSGT